MNAMSSSNESTGLRTFSGDTEDAKEYKRWRTWVTNKILTLGDKVPDNAKGAYVYTLLAGKALECVEHLEQSAYQKAGGEKIIFELLDQRFPQKDQSDEMSEALTEVFQLRAHEGESLKAWVSRATELFDRVKRKVNVAFPEEARPKKGSTLAFQRYPTPQLRHVLASYLRIRITDKLRRFWLS